MTRPIVVQQENDVQRSFLEGIVRRAWPGKTYELPTFDELRELSRQHRFRLVFVELDPGSRSQIEWLDDQPRNVVGIVSWKWEEEQLLPFINAGLSDYILKPYQPERIRRLVEMRRQYATG